MRFPASSSARARAWISASRGRSVPMRFPALVFAVPARAARSVAAPERRRGRRQAVRGA